MLNTVTSQLGRERKYSRERGGVTLEATIVFPVFLAFMLLLINFIKVALVYLAVSHAVSETAKQIATHAYPLTCVKKGTDSLESKIGVSDIASLETDMTRRLLEAAKEDASQKALDTVMNDISSSMLQNYLPGGIIGRDDIEMEVNMCNPWASGNAAHNFHGTALNSEDVAIAAHYRVKLLFPFAGARELKLSCLAVERAWVR